MTDNVPALPQTIETILAHPARKAFGDLRNRAAYIFITGCFPTHLRSETNELLRLICRASGVRASLNRRPGSLLISEEVAIRLGLADHPMANKVREYADKGFRIAATRDATPRRPYGKVFLYRQGARGEERIIVQTDGSVLDKW